MPKHSKRFNNLVKNLDLQKELSVDVALDVLKKLATAKFDETVDMAIRTGLDPKYADQQLRGSCVLPHGTGKKTREIGRASCRERV